MSLINRMVRASQFDPTVYEEVEADSSATGQAAVVIILTSTAAGIGAYHEGGLNGIFLTTLFALLSWVIWSYLTYFIGVRWLPDPETKSSPGELLRTTGLSSAPGMVRLLGVIPGTTNAVFIVAAVWMLIAMVVAVKQALDYRSMWKALGVCMIGWLIQVAVLVVVLIPVYLQGGLK